MNAAATAPATPTERVARPVPIDLIDTPDGWRETDPINVEEIARSMGYPATSSVRSLYTRALRKLRESL